MDSYAQTNVQLFNELLRMGYPQAELLRLKKAYGLAIRLFTGAFRASGKPFLAHLVGTASILARLRAHPYVIAAGLLHAAYTHGEFGDGSRGMTEEKRRRVRRVVGPDADELIARHTTFPWNERSIPLVEKTLPNFSCPYREVLLIRLANELEDYGDLGVLYCGNGRKRKDLIPPFLSQTVKMAKQLGYPRLASQLKKAFDQVASAKIPQVLRNGKSYSFFLPPASHRPRRGVRRRHLLGSRWMV